VDPYQAFSLLLDDNSGRIASSTPSTIGTRSGRYIQNLLQSRQLLSSATIASCSRQLLSPVTVAHGWRLRDRARFGVLEDCSDAARILLSRAHNDR